MDDALAGLAPGDTFIVALEPRADGSYCFAVDRARHCGAGLTPGDGWRFLLDVQFLGDRLVRWVIVAWVAALAFPLGYWLVMAGPIHRWATLLPVVGLAAAPHLGPIQAAMPIEWLGLVAGAGLGWLAGWYSCTTAATVSQRR